MIVLLAPQEFALRALGGIVVESQRMVSLIGLFRLLYPLSGPMPDDALAALQMPAQKPPGSVTSVPPSVPNTPPAPPPGTVKPTQTGCAVVATVHVVSVLPAAGTRVAAALADGFAFALAESLDPTWFRAVTAKV